MFPEPTRYYQGGSNRERENETKCSGPSASDLSSFHLSPRVINFWSSSERAWSNLFGIKTCAHNPAAANHPMSMMRAPLLNLVIGLGGFLIILPLSTANDMFKYIFPDESTCYFCPVHKTITLEIDSQCSRKLMIDPQSTLYCTAPDGACNGTYYPSWFKNGFTSDEYRIKYSVDQCLYEAIDYTGGGISDGTDQVCCFKPGSIVSISNLLVYCSGLMLGPGNGPQSKSVYRSVVSEWHSWRQPRRRRASKFSFSNIGTPAHRRSGSRYKVLPGAIRLLCIQRRQFPI